MIKSPYELVTEDNFNIIKEVLLDGAEQSMSPFQIAKNISEKTGINIQYCIALVHEELLRTMKK